MSKSRIKTSALPTAITRDQADSFVSQITQLTIERNHLIAEMDEEITTARSRYEATLGNLSARIESRTEILRDWALANPEEFGKKKSIEFTQGVVGFRTGMPKLKTLSGFTFARVLDALRSVKWGAAFILVKAEVAKAELIAAYASENITPEELRQIGVRVDQDESFFVDPAVTDNEPRQTVAANQRLAGAGRTAQQPEGRAARESASSKEGK